MPRTRNATEADIKEVLTAKCLELFNVATSSKSTKAIARRLIDLETEYNCWKFIQHLKSLPSETRKFVFATYSANLNKSIAETALALDGKMTVQQLKVCGAMINTVIAA